MPAGWITFTMEGSSSVVSTFFTQHAHTHTCEESLYHNIVSLTRPWPWPKPYNNLSPECTWSALRNTNKNTHTLWEKQSSLTSLTLWCKLCVCVCVFGWAAARWQRERHTVTLPHWQAAYQNTAACTSCCDGIEPVPLLFSFLLFFPPPLISEIQELWSGILVLSEDANIP